MKNRMWFLALLALMQVAHASSNMELPSFCRVLAPSFGVNNIISILDAELKATPERFKIERVISPAIAETRNERESLLSWLIGIKEWDGDNFSQLCRYALGTEHHKKAFRNRVSFDATLCVMDLLKNIQCDEAEAIYRALKLNHFFVSSVGGVSKEARELSIFCAQISRLPRDQLDNFWGCVVGIMGSGNIETIHASYPNFLKAVLVYANQHLSKEYIAGVWVRYYLEKHFGRNRQDGDFKQPSCVNLERLINDGWGWSGLLDFNAQPVTQRHDTLTKHYDFLHQKGWCSAEQYVNWGNILVKGRSALGGGGECLVGKAAQRNAAHYLFRCAGSMPLARILLAETIMHGVFFDEGGRPLKTDPDPKAPYKYAAKILRAVLKTPTLESQDVAQVWFRLAQAVFMDQIETDDRGNVFPSYDKKVEYIVDAYQKVLDHECLVGEKAICISNMRPLHNSLNCA
ncbi:MAG: hypothetical protein Q8K36_00435 [Alphaproteobacteria bacterium]|nr:hypothetical protein [Alphaproteobacteria bacterium]